MPGANLRPLAKTDEGFRGYVADNFRRLNDTLDSLTNIEGGEIEVTGTVTIDTGLPEVFYSLASFISDPTVDASLIRCKRVDDEPRQIEIKVFDVDMDESTDTVTVTWLAVGSQRTPKD